MSSRPARAEWVVACRQTHQAIPLCQASAWVRFLGGFTDSKLGAGYMALEENIAVQGPFIYQNILKWHPNELRWEVQVVSGTTALHYFAASLPLFDLTGWLIDLKVYDGVFEIDFYDPNQLTYFTATHQIPGKLITAMSSFLLTVAGYSNGSAVAVTDQFSVKADLSTTPDVQDLVFAMWNQETPPSLASTNEGSNTFQGFPSVATKNQISFNILTGSWMN